MSADVETVRAALMTSLSLTGDVYPHEQYDAAIFALDRLAGRVAEAEKALAEMVSALVEIGGGWRDEETPPCFCGGDSTTESLARCTRIRNLIVAAEGGAVQTGDAG